MSQSDVTNYLKSAVAAGALRHSTIVETADVARFFGVGRRAVYDAFKKLTSEYYFTVDRRNRFVAHDWEEAQFQDQFDLAIALVPLAAQRALTSVEKSFIVEVGTLLSSEDAGNDPKVHLHDRFSLLLAFLVMQSSLPNIEGGLKLLFPNATWETALVGLEAPEAEEANSRFTNIGHLMVSGGSKDVDRELVGLLTLMKDAVARKAALLAKKSSPRVTILEDLDLNEFSDALHLFTATTDFDAIGTLTALEQNRIAAGSRLRA